MCKNRKNRLSVSENMLMFRIYFVPHRSFFLSFCEYHVSFIIHLEESREE